MRVLILVALIVVVAQSAPGNDQAFGQEPAKENDSKSHVQILGNLMGIGAMEFQQIAQPENKAEAQQQQMFRNQIMDNEWKNSRNCQKAPKGYYTNHVDYSSDDSNVKCKNSTSKLPNPIKELICLIFDIGGMKRTMVEFGIDLIKMPLNKLSNSQIMKAYRVLIDVQTALSSEIAVDQMQLDEVSNRFYTIIPHDFGVQKPYLLNNIKFVKTKADMLDNLLQIEFIYSIIKESWKSGQDQIDYYYSKLKNQINILDNSTNQFSVVSKYITNNHNNKFFNITRMHIFKIDRQGEDKRYKPFKHMPNRQLLWHGSGITNFVGILSKGLRMDLAADGAFGKGIYFADTFDMSAGYSGVYGNSTALLLLSEVALGNMHQLTYTKSIKKLPKGKHSVKGVGRFQPDPNRSFMQPDGVKVPYGLRVLSNFEQSNLYDSMYIVYDEAQIKQQYLVHIDFTQVYS